MKLGKLLLLSVVLAGIIVTCRLAQAQTPGDLLKQTGVQPFGSYHGGNIDTIDLSSGKLMVDIPLISYPQRGGKLKLNYVLHYHNSAQVLGGMTGCIPLPLDPPHCIVFP